MDAAQRFLPHAEKYAAEKSIPQILELIKSMSDLQVDYIDYYLLHGVGLGGMEDLRNRFLNNGLLDFVLQERAAVRIRNLGWSYHGDIEVFDYLLSLDIQWDFVQIQLNYIDWQHATGFNTNAEYLLGELEKHNVPAVIMEPPSGRTPGTCKRAGAEPYARRESA